MSAELLAKVDADLRAADAILSEALTFGDTYEAAKTVRVRLADMLATIAVLKIGAAPRGRKRP